MTAADPIEEKAWRLIARGRRYVVIARSAEDAREKATRRWPADFSKCVPVVHEQDNL